MLRTVEFSTFCNPFFKDKHDKRRRTFSALSGKSGVYIIKNKGSVVYVGMSVYCVVKACYRHFYKWELKSRNSSKRVITYVDEPLDFFEVCILETSPEEAIKMETALIVCLDPRDNSYDGEHQIKEFINKYTAKYYEKSKPSGAYASETHHSDDLPF